MNQKLNKTCIKCKCKVDSNKCNSNKKWNYNKCWCELKNPKEHHVCKKNYIWNPATCSCTNDKYVGSINHDSVIMCDETIKEIKAVPTKIALTK